MNARSRFIQSRSLPFAGLLGVPLALFTAGAPGTTTAASTTTLATFSTPGTYSWTVPAGVTKITVLAFGGSGGNVIYTAPGPTLVLYSHGGPVAKPGGRMPSSRARRSRSSSAARAER